ncbi:unnamed protein product [Leptidea sinapis]|uniref:ATP synthase F(0) complex subunit e, mitochondrial n=1 Tax=Leptidea sinapis TaxID=189913 RepID=A0A5E4QJX1_9NEOP|nr:unnamed protein product [Leptidea sinapis]
MSFPYGPPQNVSPLIRGARFAFLVAGIFYGLGKQKLYSALEANWREEEAARKVIRDKEMARLRAKIAAEEREVINAK